MIDPAWLDELELHPASIDAVDLMTQLAKDARAIDAAAARLSKRVMHFDGLEEGEPGIKTEWKLAVQRRLLKVEEDMKAAAADPENKLPAALKSRSFKAMEAEAEKQAIADDPALYHCYLAMDAEIDALRKWLENKQRSSSIRQSILSSQRTQAYLGRQG